MVKPLAGTPLSGRHDLSRGLLYCHGLLEGAGSTSQDSAPYQLGLTSRGFGTTDPWGGGPAGGGLVCTTPDASLYSILPSVAQVGWPITIACCATLLETPTTAAAVSGIWYAVNTPPYHVLDLYWGSGLTLTAGWNYGSSSSDNRSIASLTLGQTFVASVTATSSAVAVYLDGVLQRSQPGTYGSGPAYSSTSQVVHGQWPGYTRNPGCVIYWSLGWSRALSAAEHAEIGSSPQWIANLYRRRIVAPKRVVIPMRGALSGGGLGSLTRGVRTGGAA